MKKKIKFGVIFIDRRVAKKEIEKYIIQLMKEGVYKLSFLLEKVN